MTKSSRVSIKFRKLTIKDREHKRMSMVSNVFAGGSVSASPLVAMNLSRDDFEEVDSRCNLLDK